MNEAILAVECGAATAEDLEVLVEAGLYGPRFGGPTLLGMQARYWARHVIGNYRSWEERYAAEAVEDWCSERGIEDPVTVGAIILEEMKLARKG